MKVLENSTFNVLLTILSLGISCPSNDGMEGSCAVFLPPHCPGHTLKPSVNVQDCSSKVLIQPIPNPRISPPFLSGVLAMDSCTFKMFHIQSIFQISAGGPAIQEPTVLPVCPLSIVPGLTWS